MKHPAKFSAPIMEEIIRVTTNELPEDAFILDPFAGAGGIHVLRPTFLTYGIELEPEWASDSQFTAQGDATATGLLDSSFDAVVTSPPYGNRMADQDMRPSVGATYAKILGRRVSDGSAAGMQWGPEYRTTMVSALGEIHRVLVPGGLFLLNVSDHVRDKQLQHVPEWFLMECVCMGFILHDDIEIKTRRMMRGANRARANCEHLYVFRKEA